MRVMIISNARNPRKVYELGRLLMELKARDIEAAVYRPNRFSIEMGVNGPVLEYEGKPIERPDLVLSRTGSGTASYAAAVFDAMEKMGIVVVNPLRAIQAAADKAFTMQVAAAAGLPIPKTMMYAARDGAANGWPHGFPAIFKVATGSRGRGVIYVEKPSTLQGVIDLMKGIDPKRTFLIQEYLGYRPRADIRVLVIGGKAYGAMLRKGGAGEERANVSRGGMGQKFRLNSRIIAMSEKICEILGLEIAGVDLLFKSRNEWAICEVNSSPGFSGFDEFCEADVAAAIAEYIERRLNGHAG